MTATEEHAQTIVAGMGELKVVVCRAGDQVYLKTTLGSCVGLFVADPTSRVFGVAHVMLPAPLTNDGVLGKYAETALPELIRLMTRDGRPPDLRAYIVGGASMFATEGRSFIADVGRRNVEAVRAVTQRHNVPIVLEDTGGNHGRTVTYDCAGDTIDIRKLTHPGFVVNGPSGE